MNNDVDLIIVAIVFFLLGILVSVRHIVMLEEIVKLEKEKDATLYK